MGCRHGAARLSDGTSAGGGGAVGIPLSRAFHELTPLELLAPWRAARESRANQIARLAVIDDRWKRHSVADLFGDGPARAGEEIVRRHDEEIRERLNAIERWHLEQLRSGAHEASAREDLQFGALQPVNQSAWSTAQRLDFAKGQAAWPRRHGRVLHDVHVRVVSPTPPAVSESTPSAALITELDGLSLAEAMDRLAEARNAIDPDPLFGVDGDRGDGRWCQFDSIRLSQPYSGADFEMKSFGPGRDPPPRPSAIADATAANRFTEAVHSFVDELRSGRRIVKGERWTSGGWTQEPTAIRARVWSCRFRLRRDGRMVTLDLWTAAEWKPEARWLEVATAEAPAIEPQEPPVSPADPSPVSPAPERDGAGKRRVVPDDEIDAWLSGRHAAEPGPSRELDWEQAQIEWPHSDVIYQRIIDRRRALGIKGKVGRRRKNNS